MQATIAITAGALLLSVNIFIAGNNGFTSLKVLAAEQLVKINFKSFLLDGILGFLLFAGGLKIIGE